MVARSELDGLPPVTPAVVPQTLKGEEPVDPAQPTVPEDGPQPAKKRRARVAFGP